MPAGLNRRLARDPDKPGVRAIRLHLVAFSRWRAFARAQRNDDDDRQKNPPDNTDGCHCPPCFSLAEAKCHGLFRRVTWLYQHTRRLPTCRSNSMWGDPPLQARPLPPRAPDSSPPEDRQRGHSPDDCERDFVNGYENGTTLEPVGCNVLHLTQLGLTMEPSWISSGSLARSGCSGQAEGMRRP